MANCFCQFIFNTIFKLKKKFDYKNKLGDTPIHNAAVKNRIEVIEFLKEKGVRFDILNSDLKSPYDLALDAKCKALLEYNVDYHSRMNKDYFNDEDGNDSDDWLKKPQ